MKMIGRKMPVVLILWLPIAGTLAIADADAAEPAGDGIAACRSIADDRTRLICYDRINVSPGSVDSTIAEGERAAQKPVISEPEDRFGFMPRPEPGQQDESRMMEIATVSKQARGSLYLEMTNGQKWQQVDTARLSTPKPGMSARIEKGAMGGFLLSIDGRSFRAKRVE